MHRPDPDTAPSRPTPPPSGEGCTRRGAARSSRADDLMQPPHDAARWMALDELVPWEHNPRLNNHAVLQVARSIERFGFGAPLVAARNGEIIAGHTRWKAAQHLRRHQLDPDTGEWRPREGTWVVQGAPGADQVPVRVLDLAPAEAHAYAVADNRLAEEAEWNPLALQQLAEDGMDLEEVGFSEAEIETLFAGEEDSAPSFQARGQKERSVESRAVVTMMVDVVDASRIESALDVLALAGETRGATLVRVLGTMTRDDPEAW